METFCYDNEKFKPNNEAQEKDLEKRKVMVNTASKLYDKLLNIYTQDNKFLEDLKKRVNVLNKTEMLIIDFDRDDLPPIPALEYDTKVILEPGQTIAERMEVNPQKKIYKISIKNLDLKQIIN